MKKIHLILIIAAAGLLMQSCKTASLGIRHQSSYLELKAADLEVSQRMTAEAKTTRILGIDWSRLFNNNGAAIGSGYAPVIGDPYYKLAGYDQNKALYKLLKENPDYDVVMYPRFEEKKFRILIFFSVTDTRVSGRLAKLKNETPSTPK